jgi:hypothetical protein
MKKTEQEQSWTSVLIEVLLKILTLGLYHVQKHKKQ